jgi:hypothetical protein
MEKQRAPLVVQIVLFVIVFSFAFWGTKTVLPSLLPPADEIIARQMKKEADSINKTLPMIVEVGVRAENMEVIDAKNLQYNMTLLDVNDDTPKIYLDALKKKAMANTQKYYNENSTMKEFKKRDIAITYFFMDTHGKEVFQYKIGNTK